MPGFRPLKGQLWLGYDIETQDGVCPSPKKIIFWNDSQFKSSQPEAPFHFKADALVGLSLVQLNPHFQNPFSAPGMNFSTAHQYWQGLEPHYELFQRCQPRVRSLQSSVKTEAPTHLQKFETQFTEILGTCSQSWGYDLESLSELLSSIDQLEIKTGQTLLYNFNLNFSRDVSAKLHHLYSFLFHLRTLCAMDHNAHIIDPTHQSVKVDSINDYLSRADYVANDAVLYFQFRKLKDKMGPAGETMEKHFHNFAHNACSLVQNLPKSFINSLPQDQLEDAFYLSQMDWLLGTEAGLLFRIREEIFGLTEGYEKIFWPEIAGDKKNPGSLLTVNCLLTEKEVFHQTSAA
jgi:hypothetical protein